jgi:hypothetical protein
MAFLLSCAFRGSVLCVTAVLLLCGCSDPLAGGATPRAPVTEVPQDEAELKQRIDNVRTVAQRRYMNTTDHAAWQIVHGILAFQDKLEIYHQGKRVKALRWLLEGGPLRGFTLIPRENGLLDSLLESGSRTGQGHDDQWLGYLDACEMRADDGIVWQGQKYKIRGMVEQAKRDLREGNEYSWTLMALSGFAERDPDLVPFDQSWEVRSTGPGGKEVVQHWSLERIIGFEADQSLIDSPCGGTHRLVGMTLALRRYRQWHQQTHGSEPQFKEDSGWLKADRVVRYAMETFRQSQQPDGAFSAAYLQRPSTTADVEHRVRTTGHVFEFFSWSLPSSELKAEWMARAAVHLCELFENTQKMPIDCGALYHAARGLQVYRERRWGKD